MTTPHRNPVHAETTGPVEPVAPPPSGDRAAVPTSPVFVDGTGRRKRALTLTGYVVGALCVTYVSLVGVSFAAGPASPLKGLPLVGVGGEPVTAVVDAARDLAPAGDVEPADPAPAPPPVTTSSATAEPGTPVVSSAPVPAPEIGLPLPVPVLPATPRVLPTTITASPPPPVQPTRTPTSTPTPTPTPTATATPPPAPTSPAEPPEQLIDVPAQP